MKDDDQTRYVCLGCKEYLTVREVREDAESENLCAKCKAKRAAPSVSKTEEKKP